MIKLHIMKAVAYIKTNTFTTINLWFVAILLFSTIAISSFSYYVYEAFIVKNAIDSSRMNLDFIMENVDDEITSLQNATLSVLSNKDLVNFEHLGTDTTPDTLFKVKAMMRELKYIQNSYPQINSIWLYSVPNQVVITSNGRFTADEFFGKRVVIEPIYGSDISASMARTNYFGYFSTSIIKDLGYTSKCTSFIRSTPTYTDNPIGQIILNTDSKLFDDILNKAIYKEDMTVLLVDGEQNIISSTENTSLSFEDSKVILSKLSSGELSSTGDVFEFELNNVKYNGFVASSNQYDFQYVILLNKEALLDGISLIRILTVALIIFGLFISVFCTFAITKKVFAPIRKVIEYIKSEQVDNHSDVDDHTQYRDVYLIEKFISYMKKSNGLLQCRIDNYTSVMQEMLITELIYSSDSTVVLKKYAEFSIASSFPYKCFTILIVPLKSNEATGFVDTKQLEQQLQSLQNNSKYSSGLKIYTITQSDKIILTINSKQQYKTNIVKEFFDDLKATYLLSANSELICAYGKTYASIENLHDSFHQAFNVLTVKVIGESKNINYDKAMNAKYVTSNYSKDMEAKLIKLVKSNSSNEAVKDLVIEIINQNQNGSLASDIRLESLFVQFIMTINRIMDEMDINSTDIFGKDINHYRIIDRYPTIEGKEEYILSAFDKLTTYIKSIKTNKAFDIYQYMLTHVAEHSHEDISLNDISYSLGLSSPYLSNVFKEFHNTNFLDYLNGYRIAKAKELLSDSNLSINDISVMVGYSNANTFIRVFKKSEGATPGQFRTKDKGQR